MSTSYPSPTLALLRRRRKWFISGGLAAIVVFGPGLSGYLAWCGEQCTTRAWDGWLDTPPLEDGQRNALRHLAFLVARCPRTKRFTIAWNEPGTKFAGIRPHLTEYNRETSHLRDANMGLSTLELGGVRPPSLYAGAFHSDDFEALRQRVLSPAQRTGETLGAQLQKAVEAGDRTQVRALLHQGAEANYCPDAITFSPAEARSNPRLRQAETPLAIAARRGDVSMVRLLLEHNADPTLPGPNGSLLNSTDSVVIAALLVRYGAPVNAPDQGLTEIPLHHAVYKGDPQMVAFLVAQGADVTAKDYNGDTPLDRAGQELKESLENSNNEVRTVIPARRAIIRILQQAQRHRKL